VDSNIVDLSKLTVEELFEEVQKRVQASPDTKLKRKLATLLSVVRCLQKEEALLKKQRSMDKPSSFAPGDTMMAH
jgi:hypothetical protein